MSEPVASAMRALAENRLTLEDAFVEVPDRAGLYAVHAPDEVWRGFGLDPGEASRPLYVGKAEDSLVSRDLRTHFASGRTGSSTLRRSFAALLRADLDLHARPRNPANPGHFASFGLSPEGDERLTSWMREHLTLATWVRPEDVVLRQIEVAILRSWQPPLNLTDVPAPWRVLKSLRAEMAAEARIWSPQ